MTLNIASLNVRGLRDSSKCACLLGELPNLGVNVAAVQKTHFTCSADCHVLEDDFVIFSVFGSSCYAGVSLIVGCSLDAIVNLVFADDGCRLIVADVAVKNFEFWVVVVCAPNSAGERRPFFRRWEPFLDDPKRIVLVGDWNAILDPKIDKGGRGTSGSARCESSLIDLLAEFDLITQDGSCGCG